VRASIKAILGQEVVANGEEGEESRRDRRHAAGGHQRRLGVLERGELLVQGNMVWRVVEADIAESVVVGLAAVLERGGLKDRNAHRAFDARHGLTGMD